MNRLHLILALVAILGMSSHAAATDVLIVGTDTTANSDYLNNSRQALVNSGVIAGTIDTFNGRNGTPTLAQLQQYQSVVVWTFWTFADSFTMGNVLADYVAGGGGVVLLQFCSDSGSFGVYGNFISQGYMPIVQGGYTSTSVTMGTVDDPSHPIMQNISHVSNGGQSGLFSGSLTSNGTRIAAWSNNWPMVVEHTGLTNGSVVFVNITGFTTAMEPWGYDDSSDAARLIANAANYVGGGGNPDLEVTLNGPSTVTMTDADSTGPTGDGHILADLTIETAGEDWTVTEIEFVASGSGDASTAFDQLALYEDTNGNDQFDGSATDLLATNTAGIAFSSSNGTYSATLSDPAFPPYTTRRFFLVGRLDNTANPGDTFQAGVSSVTATSAGGGAINGLPTASSAGIEINPALVEVTRHGPNGSSSVPFDAQGPTGDGVLLLDFSLAVRNADFTVAAFDLTAFGTGNDAEHYSEIALYKDDGSGTWDGASTDTLLTSASAFPANDGTWTAGFGQTMLPRGSTERYFVVGKYNGTAPNGATFGVRLSAVSITAPGSFQESGIPTSVTTAVTIQTPLTISSISPLRAPLYSETPLTIRGTGFVSPVTLTIGGEEAGGIAHVNASGTEIIGLTSPPITGEDLVMVLTVAGASPMTLSQRFTYGSIRTGSSGCATAAHGQQQAWLLGLVVLLLSLVWSRRRAERMLLTVTHQ